MSFGNRNRNRTRLYDSPLSYSRHDVFRHYIVFTLINVIVIIFENNNPVTKTKDNLFSRTSGQWVSQQQQHRRQSLQRGLFFFSPSGPRGQCDGTCRPIHVGEHNLGTIHLRIFKLLSNVTWSKRMQFILRNIRVKFRNRAIGDCKEKFCH